LDMDNRFAASLVLSAVGDSIGYYLGNFGSCSSGERIAADVEQITQGGGIGMLEVDSASFPCSAHTMMTLATAETLCAGFKGLDLLQNLAKAYKAASKDTLRSLDNTTIQSLFQLRADGSNWDAVEYHPHHIGSSPAVRACCIGLRYPAEDSFQDLIGLAVESCRITHHHPTAILGAATTAACTSWALRGIQPRKWGLMVLQEVVPQVEAYVEEALDSSEANLASMAEFKTTWNEYLSARNLPRPMNNVDAPECVIPDPSGDGISYAKDRLSKPLPPLEFPADYGIAERDTFYTAISHLGCGGSSGHDAPIIALDGLLGTTSWEELCQWTMLHGGDSAATGAIAGAWYGALYGFQGVPHNHYREIEHYRKILTTAQTLMRTTARS